MDIIAGILELSGIWLLTEKSRAGFFVLMAGNIFWFATGLKNGLAGLVVAAVIFFMINVRGIRKWQC